MSEITERTNIISIAEMPVQDIHASMVQLKEMSYYQPLNVVLSNVGSFIPSEVLNVIKSTTGNLSFKTSDTTIKSPNQLRASFKDNFSPILTKMEINGINPIVARKATLLNTLNKMDFKIKQGDTISSNLKAVLQANEIKVLNTEIKTVMKKLEEVHTEVFVKNIANACATASHNIGFREVEVKTVQGKLEVIATNNNGQRIISEINIDAKTNQVNANTETKGIIDGSCSLIISNFNDELKKMGIKIGNEKTTFTRGICQLQYSKIIDQQDKEAQRKKKEHERLKKLNSFNKQKI